MEEVFDQCVDVGRDLQRHHLDLVLERQTHKTSTLQVNYYIFFI